jgi:hypothetical protein
MVQVSTAALTEHEGLPRGLKGQQELRALFEEVGTSTIGLAGPLLFKNMISLTSTTLNQGNRGELVFLL